jgi:hypothetical protein
MNFSMCDDTKTTLASCVGIFWLHASAVYYLSCHVHFRRFVCNGRLCQLSWRLFMSTESSQGNDWCNAVIRRKYLLK